MSNVSGATNYFPTVNEGFATTVGVGGVSSGGTTVPLTSVTGLTNGSVFVGVIEPGTTNQQVFTGIVNTGGSSITGVVWTRGANVAHAAGVTVVDYVTGTAINLIVTGILKQHTQAGAHTGLTTDTLTTSGNASVGGSATLATLIPQAWDGWVYDTHTWTYVSATSFKITGVNVTALFPTGTKIKLIQSGVTAYFYVTGATFSTDTTVTITGGSDYTLSNTTITSPAYSYATTPQGFPGWFNWSPTWTNFTVGNATLSAAFTMNGRLLTARLKLTWGSTTSASGIIEFSPPVTPFADYTSSELLVGLATGVNIGVAIWNGVVKALTSSIFTFTSVATNSGTNPVNTLANSGTDWTGSTPFSWATGSIIFAQFAYEVA
jgi:hypothetical protein